MVQLRNILLRTTSFFFEKKKKPLCGCYCPPTESRFTHLAAGTFGWFFAFFLSVEASALQATAVRTSTHVFCADARIMGELRSMTAH